MIAADRPTCARCGAPLLRFRLGIDDPLAPPFLSPPRHVWRCLVCEPLDPADSVLTPEAVRQILLGERE